ncbi:MAG: dTDP-glucose 4,6-dehydratase [Candidatus Aureabacteria bacterium]|nr:dTDP-glucose 4,6-dehydratase [Candidatus Auribacterota bacterium]
MNVKTYLVTGGLGFIGSNFIRHILTHQSHIGIVNLDKMTYAGNPVNLKEFEGHERYRFVKGDICDRDLVDDIFSRQKPAVVVNFAAESHVDRSIEDAAGFIKTDIEGVWNLLEKSRTYGLEKFIQISTDEVYGAITEGAADENYPLKPSNPYSASKAGGDRLAFSYFVTYGMPVIVTRASNNYGPFQYPEKLIPLFITNALEDRKLPVYGDGRQRRDWLHVVDHCEAIQYIIEKGAEGETYNIAGNCEKVNLDVTEMILDILKKPKDLISYVKDRPGHDRRYSLDANKLFALGWKPGRNFEEGLRETVEWYVKNDRWWRKIKSGEFREYYKKHYSWRLEDKE